MPTEVWCIHLLGGFRVEAPDGAEIPIVSRKARALVSLLALNDGVAISRESLGCYLWPDKPRESQQQNLRQAVKEVRRAFAPMEALSATRDVCRLALDNFTCDAAECLRSGKDAGNLTLLPEMLEPVFDTYRSELASYAPTGELGEVVRSATSLLEWTLAKEPSRVLEMLHAVRDLIPNLPLPQLEEALRRGLAESSSEFLRAWASTQFALVLMWAGRYEEGLAVAKSALSVASPETDPYSWANAACSAAFLMILRGRFESAGKLLDGAIAIVEARGLAGEANLLRHAQALRQFHMGDFPGALAMMGVLTPNALTEAHFAVCLSLVGKLDEARQRLKSARELAGNAIDSPRLKSQIEITEAHILLQEGRLDEARAILDPLVQLCENHGFRLIRIHALEGLALLEQDAIAAKALIKHAISLRERFGLPLLPGDRIRLARVLDQRDLGRAAG